MQLYPNSLFHIYNRGNNRQKIFFRESNYRFFLKKIRTQMVPHVDILAYCLMPNHFHFMVSTGLDFDPAVFSRKYGIMLSSYTRAINLQESRTGSLFQQKSKAREIRSMKHGLICLNYIHLNPIRAGLTKKLEDWEYSSFGEYIDTKASGLVDRRLAAQLLDLPYTPSAFVELSWKLSPENVEKVIF